MRRCRQALPAVRTAAPEMKAMYLGLACCPSSGLPTFYGRPAVMRAMACVQTARDDDDPAPLESTRCSAKQRAFAWQGRVATNVGGERQTAARSVPPKRANEARRWLSARLTG
jgi:hypothetical protein